MEDISDKLLKTIKNMPEKERHKLYKALKELYPLEKRRHTRAAYPSDVRYTSLELFGKDFLRDISAGGVFLKTTTPFTIGRPITLIIPSTDGQTNIKVRGEVVRVTSDGVGIKFIRKV